MFVCSTVENEMPVFNKIVNIVLKDEKAFLLTSRVTTTCFNEHVHAFCIEGIDDMFTVICVSDLIYYRPFDRQFSYGNDESHYIVPYCAFVSDCN